MDFNEEKDLALCGLACVLCSLKDCPGCKARGCKEHCDCTVYHCATEKKLDGCYECEQFPCEEKMLKGVRNRAFNHYAREHGKQELLNRLRTNFQNGIVYHRTGGLAGDYDLYDTEEDILWLIDNGRHDPYARCPVFETESFILRLVAMQDAKDLLVCYTDEKATRLFDRTNCTYGYGADSIDTMESFIKRWLWEYQNRNFVRFSIIGKSTGAAAGTIEIFRHPEGFGILRLDILSDYEEFYSLKELFALCIQKFFILFSMERIITKAIPEAADRILVLKELGFESFHFKGMEDYWVFE